MVRQAPRAIRVRGDRIEHRVASISTSCSAAISPGRRCGARLALDRVEICPEARAPAPAPAPSASARDIVRGKRETLEELDAVGLRSAGRDDDS
jgi:hypothetical protein